eukprot:3328836-Pleurochrysis_carterae.AAC.1
MEAEQEGTSVAGMVAKREAAEKAEAATVGVGDAAAHQAELEAGGEAMAAEAPAATGAASALVTMEAMEQVVEVALAASLASRKVVTVATALETLVVAPGAVAHLQEHE